MTPTPQEVKRLLCEADLSEMPPLLSLRPDSRNRSGFIEIVIIRISGLLKQPPQISGSFSQNRAHDDTREETHKATSFYSDACGMGSRQSVNGCPCAVSKSSEIV